MMKFVIDKITLLKCLLIDHKYLDNRDKFIYF